MSDEPAEDQLRTLVGQALAETHTPQAEVARQLGVSTKHLSQMLTGRATLTLTWAEGILGLLGRSLLLTVTRDEVPQ